MTDEPEAKRRLWFLQVLVGKMGPEEALLLPARMEAFVTDGIQPTIFRAEGQRRTVFGEDEQRHATPPSPAQLSVEGVRATAPHDNENNSAAGRPPSAA